MVYEDQKLQVQQATDIVRLIGNHVALKPRGKEFVGLCPFHDDTSPSLYVSPSKQIFKCFSCGAGGDVFGFVMRLHKLSFPESLEHLADAAGIRLRSTGRAGGAGGPGDAATSQRKQIGQANSAALAFFRQVWADPKRGLAGREAAGQRNIDDHSVEAFQIGCAPDEWDGLTRHVASHGAWAMGALEQAGLITARKQGQGHYDRFRHRLIFPIFDEFGRPIAFGGRILRDDDTPKYLNSPESVLFNKSATLYGLHLAKKAVINSKQAVIVEGYTDVVACYQAGFKNVVATLGTALTGRHVQLLSRLCERVVLVFDGDEAGLAAADRAVEVFLNGPIDVAVATLPDGQDPADYSQSAGRGPTVGRGDRTGDRRAGIQV